ncbi:MAG: hypothetical protein KDJ45_04530 [Hyphomicrobiaceae bacterium]|nr:hypothetical protein [Hyphomicrobiaceae bacterium]MCC0009104.1 hypothetical protein [Hyphomicrobiaceae bacterium]
MDFNDKQILPPKNWQTFEDLCLELFRREWADRTATKNGRSGQPQHGTDISGRPRSAAGKWHGVQCKGKDAAYGAELTEKEIIEEAEKAKAFKPALEHWIIVTTAAKDGKLEEFARVLTVKNEAAGLFSVQALGWADLQGMIANHPEVIAQFYPDQAPRIQQTLRKLGDHFGLVDPAVGLDELIKHGRKAAADDLQKFLRTARLISSIPLDLECLRDGKRGAAERTSVIDELIAGSAIILEAEPGAGKSTTLLQLSGDVLAQSNDRVPVCVRLPEFVLGRKSVLDEIAGKSSFRDVSFSNLQQLAMAGKLILFCDGWNEITGERRTTARTEIEKFQREYPDCSVLIATRMLAPAPFRTPATYYLLPLTRAKQEKILVDHLGAKGSDLLTKARRIPGLRDVLQVPMYLSALAVLGASGMLPTTKEEVIRRFLEAHAREPLHDDALAKALKGCHDTYLRTLAVKLIEAGTVSISDKELRPIFAEVARRLMAEGHIGTPPEPSDVIDVLVSHHVLVERDDGGDRLYSFQHQQFQEWYASFWVESIFKSAMAGMQEEATRRDQLLDQQIWEEPVLFAIERLGLSGGSGAMAVGQSIVRAVGIDPMLAAEMIQRSPSDVWSAISAPIKAFASAWFSTDERDRAVTFMMATGKPDFADQVWSVIEDDHAYNQVFHRRGYFSPSVLGSEWKNRFQGLPDERRRVLLWDVASSGTDGIEFAIEALAHEHSAQVATSALEILEYRATDTELANVLDPASDELWQSLAERRRLEDFPENFRPKLAEQKAKLLARLPVGVQRTRLLAELGQVDDDAMIQQAIDLVLSSKYDDYRAEEHALEEIAATAPEKLSGTIIGRLIGGQTLSYAAGRFARASEASDQDAVRGIACEPGAQNHHRSEAAARLLTDPSVKKVVEEFLRLCGELHGKAWGESTQLRERRNACADALHHVPFEFLVRAILAQPVTAAYDIAALAELIFRWRDDDRDRKGLPLKEPLATELSQQVRDWISRLVALPDVKRHELCNLAPLIKALARPELLPSLKELLDKDLALWRAQRKEAEIAWSQGKRDRTSEASMSYVEIYRGAFEAFEGTEARQVLLGLLDNPDFTTQAAFALLKYDRAVPRSSNDSSGRAQYERATAARLARITRPMSEGEVAKAILDKVDDLLAKSDPASISLGVTLATAAAQMHFGKRIDSLHAALNAPGSMGGRIGLIKCLLEAGEDIDIEWVRKGLAETIEYLNKNRDYNRDEWWQVRQWLELFAFTPQPAEILEHVARLPEHFKYGYRLRDLAWVAPFAGENAIALLDGLAKQSPELVEAHEWLTAFQRIGTAEAADHLISVIADVDRTRRVSREFFTARNVLSDLLRRHPSRIARLVEIAGEREGAARGTIATLIGEALDEEGIMAFLQIVTGISDPLVSGLVEAVRNLSLDKRPSEFIHGGYDQEPANLASLRKRLFEQIGKNGDSSAAAALLLVTIDRQRDTYGQPPEAPRHPDLKSGNPWPLAAEAAWNAKLADG